MLNTAWAIVREGKIELLEPANLPEGRKVLVTILPESDENLFWLNASQPSLQQIWEHPDEEVYGELLKE
jgi:hypothetical protein